MATAKLSKRSAWGMDPRGCPIQLYEALVPAECYDCQTTIEVGSLFSRAIRGARTNVSICSECRPFEVMDEPPPPHARRRSFAWPAAPST